ncbi:maleylpyruvate isomerase family mycothiol-dependent enzyme [Streptomyces pactum]|uniref:maleylpyruvate isomerase family mycothiol-dependent enzyme n=1 Tax=Streptomyces pactum TaxID=68249 RepID=UPI0036F7D16B
MTLFTFKRYCDEIVDQTDQLRKTVRGADLSAPVPSCPDWTIGQLLRHVGGAHRWVETIVRTRAPGPIPQQEDHGLADDATEIDGWLAEGAAQLAGTLREAGTEAQMWTAVPGRTTLFWARRMVHETVVHRADAALAAGAEYPLATDVAVDALDEWMELGALPQLMELHPERRELLGPGRTLHLHATDTGPQTAAEWLVDLGGEAVTWRRAHEKAAVAVRGPVTDLLLLVYRRTPADHPGLEVLGDAELLDFWLERVAFG